MANLGGNVPNMRSMYRASQLGWRIIHADHSQQELRVMHRISKDYVLGAALATGDVYTADGIAIFGLPEGTTKCKCKNPHMCEQPTKHIKPRVRTQCKIGHLAFQYGCGFDKFHMQMLESDRTLKWEMSKSIFEGLRKRYHLTLAYWEEEMGKVLKTGYSESRILYRRRAYPQKPPITEVANWPVQTTAADLIGLVIIDLRKRLLKYNKRKEEALLIAQQHDAIDVEAHPKILDDVQEDVKQAMEIEVLLAGEPFNVPCEIKRGRYLSRV